MSVRDFHTFGFAAAGGKLGETRILWRLRMQYKWSKALAEERPDWDQCCTCWTFALTEAEARRKVWDKFKLPYSVMPVAVASCEPERFETQDDRDKDAALAAGSRRAKTPKAVECEASQSGGEAVTPNLSHPHTDNHP